MHQERIPQLDAVRGLAILLVILHNTSAKYPSLHLQSVFANGWMGVDLFFVLSGFLITGILIDTKQADGYFTNFYARRCLRIWPLYYSLIVLMFVVVPALRPSDSHMILERSSPWWAYPLLLQNFLVPNVTMSTGLLGVTWSLAIEEQFYLIWPWVIRYCSASRLRLFTITVICLSPALRYWLSLHDVDLYPQTFCRLDGLMAGALLALLVRSDTFRPSQYVRRAWIVLLVAAPLSFATEAFDARWIVFSLTAAASAAVVYLAIFSTQRWIKAALSTRFLVYTGTISYGLYLLHKIPVDVAQTLHADGHPILTVPIVLAASYAMAAVSLRWFEQPFLKLKRFFESDRISSDRLRPPLVGVAHGSETRIGER
jgi:peptidoglycan/LPS O-acetylase OafA/YrhL